MNKRLSLRSLAWTFLSAFATGFSGAIVPGPLLLVCAHETLRSGFGAGMMAVVGHAGMEFVVVFAMLAGLAGYLKRHPGAFGIVKVAAGGVLVLLGALMIATAPGAELQVRSASGHAAAAGPLLMGAAVSIGNPYFALWWATVGLGLLGSAARLGRPAVACFYVGHVLSDFAWFAFVAGSLALGRSVIVGGPAYRVLLMASGVFLVGFGLYFAIVRRRGQPASG